VNFWAWTSSSGSMLARSAALSCFDRVLFRGYLPVTGDAIWLEILATPTCHPATGIPTRKLLIKRGDTWEPKTEIIGPGYRAAYGLVALVHHQIGSSARATVRPTGWWRWCTIRSRVLTSAANCSSWTTVSEDTRLD